MTDKESVARDSEGYVVDPNQWDEPLARAIAAETDLDLTGDHWRVLHFMRAYWSEHQVVPDVRHVVDFLVEQHGFDRKTGKDHLFGLFPYGYMQQGCKIAGMQRPRAWSTG